VHVHNDNEEMVLPAYVTSKIVLGTACIYKGANYIRSNGATALDPQGMDIRGGENLLTSGRDNPMVPPTVSGLVQVEKY
jgi:hypothetical protein